MGSSGVGGLQGLLEHAAREYEKVDTETRGPEVVRSSETSAVLKRSNRPGSPKSSGSADPEEQSADRTASDRSRGSSPRDAGAPSRKRQRVIPGATLRASLSPGRGLNSHFSDERGALAGESYAGDAEPAAGKDGAGANHLDLARC